MAIYNLDNKDNIVYNGTEVDKVVYNGTEVWNGGAPPTMSLTSADSWFYASMSGNLNRRLTSDSGYFTEDNNMMFIDFSEYININRIRWAGWGYTGSDDNYYFRFTIVYYTSAGSEIHSRTFNNTSNDTSINDFLEGSNVDSPCAYVKIYANDAESFSNPYNNRRNFITLEFELDDGTRVDVFE